MRVSAFVSIFFVLTYSGTLYSFAAQAEITISNDDLLFVTTLTKDQLEECNDIHTDYLALDEATFAQRYIHHDFVGSCVMLFDDPIWDYDGADRHDKLSERATELATERKPRQVLMSIEPHLIVESRIPQNFLITFNACTLEQPVKASAIIVASDKELVSTISFSESDFVMPPNTCNIHEVQIKASAPHTIRLLIPGADVALSGDFSEPTQSKTQKATGENIAARVNKNEVYVGKLSNLLHVDRPLTERELKQCESFYQDFTSLDGDSFALRYRYHKFTGDCVLLYNDSIWDYNGEDRPNTLNHRLEELRHPTASKEIKSFLPEWIKDNMRQWHEGKTDETGFTSGIRFMIEEKLINMPDSHENLPSTEEKIPDWIRNNAGWWADGLITEDEFVSGMQYLIERGVIKF